MLVSDRVEPLPLDIVEPELEELGIVELLRMPEPVVDEPDDVVVPVAEGRPLEGCERSPCDKLPLGLVVDDEGIVDGFLVVPDVPDVVAGPTSFARSVAVVGAVVGVIGAVPLLDGVVAGPTSFARSVAAVGAGPGIGVVPVVLVPAVVGGPTFSVRSVAVAEGVVDGVCAEAMPIEANSAAAAAAVLKCLKVFIWTPGV